MDNRVRIVAGLTISVFMIGILVYLVGFQEFLSTIKSADTMFVGIVMASSVVWISMWGGTFYIVTNYLNIPFSYLKSIRTYSTIMFANNVTPFAHLGGEPIAAGFISNIVDEDYEKCLGAISAVSVVHFIPSVFFFVLGSLYIVTIGSGVPDSLDGIMLLFLLLTISIITVGVVLGKYRSFVEENISSVLIFVLKVLALIPRVPEYQTEDVREKVNAYFSNFIEVATSPRVVLLSTIASTLGVFFQVTALWAGLVAVGVQIPFILVLITVPVAGLASALPLPGGAGGIEAVMITILVSLTEFDASGVATGVILMRGAIYWTPVIIGTVNLGYETSN
jgi:uncharacterized protein (TIRG00374 family)